MGDDLTNLSFDEWIKCVFDHPVTIPRWYHALDRLDCANTLKSSTTVDYLSKLFQTASGILAPYSDQQINDGLWYIVNVVASNHMYSLQRERVPLPARKSCIRSIYTLYEKLFPIRCTPTLSHLNEHGNPMNLVCYMWWEVTLQGRPKGSYVEKMGVSPEHRGEQMAYVRSFDADEYRQIEYTIIGVMKQILELKSDACRESALHGLGHWSRYYGKAVQNIIDKWLRRHPDLRPELRDYAERTKFDAIP